MSTALWVNTFHAITDAEKVARYAELAGPAMIEHGGRFLVRGEPAAVFEEGRMLRTSVIEFPSVEAAVAAYESEQYQRALRALDGGAVRDIRILPTVNG